MRTTRSAGKGMAWFLAMVLTCCIALPAATAEWTITAEKTDTYENEGYLFPRFLDISTALISKDGKGYVLRDADGHAISKTYDEIGFPSSEYPVLSVCRDGRWGAVNGAGDELVPCKYTYTEACSEKWVIGILGRQAEGDEAYDYRDKTRITQADVYYLGTQVASLTRDEYEFTFAYGDYLIVKRREELNGVKYIGISATGEKREAEQYKQYIGEPGNIIHTGSGQPAFTADCSLNEESLAPTLWHIGGGVISDIHGNTFTLPAEIRMTYDFPISCSNGYFIVKSDDKKEGIYTITGEEILPCVYDEIGGYGAEMFARGYQVVVKDGRVGYVDTSGKETSGFQIAYTDDLKGYFRNCPFLWVSDILTGKVLIVSAAKGILSREYDKVVSSWSPYSLVLGVEDGGLCGAIDLYGNEIIPLQYQEISIAHDGSFAACKRSKGSYSFDIYRITCSESENDPEADEQGHERD